MITVAIMLVGAVVLSLLSFVACMAAVATFPLARKPDDFFGWVATVALVLALALAFCAGTMVAP